MAESKKLSEVAEHSGVLPDSSDLYAVVAGASRRVKAGVHVATLDEDGKVKAAQLPAAAGTGDMLKTQYDPANSPAQVLKIGDRATSVTLGAPTPSNLKMPTELAVKTYIDGADSALSALIALRLLANDASVTNRRKPAGVIMGAIPGVNQDFAAGFNLFDLVEYDDVVYMCCDPANGVAKWTRVGDLTPAQLANLALAATAVQPAALIPRQRKVINAAATLNLSMDHDLRGVHCTHATPTLHLRKQVTYAWSTGPVQIPITGEQDITITREDATVVVNGNASTSQIKIEGGSTGAYLEILATNSWWLTGTWAFI